MLFAGREEPDHHDQPVAELGERQMWRQPAVNPPLRARRTEFQQSVKNTKLTTGPRPPQTNSAVPQDDSLSLHFTGVDRC